MSANFGFGALGATRGMSAPQDSGRQGSARQDSGRPDSARPLDAAAAAVAIVLCLSWGFNQVAVKLALPDIPPLIQATIRSSVGALVVILWARLRGVRLTEPDGTLLPGIVAGVLFGLEFLLIYRGLLWTNASRASLFIYVAPFLVVIGARWLLPGDRFDLWQWLGLLLSFCGLLVAFGVPVPGADIHMLLGDLMLVGAGAAWAATTLVIKASKLVQISFEKALLYQLVVSAPMLMLGVLVFGERMAGPPSLMAIGSLIYQTF